MVSVSASASSGRGAFCPKEEPSSSKEPLVFGRASLIWDAPALPGLVFERQTNSQMRGKAATIERNPPSLFGKTLWFPGEGLLLRERAVCLKTRHLLGRWECRLREMMGSVLLLILGQKKIVNYIFPFMIATNFCCSPPSAVKTNRCTWNQDLKWPLYLPMNSFICLANLQYT